MSDTPGMLLPTLSRAVLQKYSVICFAGSEIQCFTALEMNLLLLIALCEPFEQRNEFNSTSEAHANIFSAGVLCGAHQVRTKVRRRRHQHTVDKAPFNALVRDSAFRFHTREAAVGIPLILSAGSVPSNSFSVTSEFRFLATCTYHCQSKRDKEALQKRIVELEAELKRCNHEPPPDQEDEEVYFPKKNDLFCKRRFLTIDRWDEENCFVHSAVSEQPLHIAAYNPLFSPS
ncbi:hypothetical protein Q9966_012189 [Columba livia]|nr:hypothetical protein Q9966_012189 [Columba livia]